MSFAPPSRRFLQEPSSNGNQPQIIGISKGSQQQQQQQIQDSPQQHQKSFQQTEREKTTLQQSPSPPQNYLSQSHNYASVIQRLELIESNLSRVCNQHDALMPLLNLLEALPQLQKNEVVLKTIQKKQFDIDQKIQKFEQQQVQGQNSQVFGTIERNFKNNYNQLSSLKSEVKDVNTAMSNLSRQNDIKMKEEVNQILRSVDTKLEKNKKDIQNLLADFKNQISLNLKRNEDTLFGTSSNNFGGGLGNNSNRNSNNHFNILSTNQQGQFSSMDNQQLSMNLEGLRTQIEKDQSNIYREIGMLRSELDLIIDQPRKQQIKQQVSQIPSEVTNQLEKQLFVNNIEQQVCFKEFDAFEKSNQAKLSQEIVCLEDSLKTINIQISQQQQKGGQGYNNNGGGGGNGSGGGGTGQEQEINETAKEELDYLSDRYFNLKQQISGTWKKYLVDVRKMEYRLQKSLEIKQQLLIEQRDKGKNQAILFQQFQNMEQQQLQIDQINKQIIDNVENLQAKQKAIDLNIAKIRETLR